MTIDPYRLLGVAETARDAEIRAAYLARVREFSPEKDPERFDAIRKAYESIATLSARIDTALFDTTPPTPDEVFEAMAPPVPCPLSFDALRSHMEKR